MFLRDDVYKIDCTKGAYAYVVKNDRGITMIDTHFPNKGQEILDELAAAGLAEVDRILLTHADMDHMGNAVHIQGKTGCKVYLSAREQESIDDPSKNKSYGERNPLEGQQLPDLTVLEGEEIAGLKIIPSYGHTWGHTCYQWGDVLFIGDLVSEQEGKLVEMALHYIRDRELSWAAAKDVSDNNEFTLVCPAHGEPLACTEIDFTISQ